MKKYRISAQYLKNDACWAKIQSDIWCESTKGLINTKPLPRPVFIKVLKNMFYLVSLTLRSSAARADVKVHDILNNTKEYVNLH